MGRSFSWKWFSAILIAGWGLLAGCATPPSAHPNSASAMRGEKPPFAYEPLAVHNSCFVEAVHFYDCYFQKQPAAEKNWAQVLEWGNQEGDFKVTSGHAVTVFLANDRLGYYDINFGVQWVDLAPERRSDLTDVAPKIFAKYPQFRPILARYRYDFPQQAPKKPATFLFYHANPDVRDATRVASELGRVRPVRVLEFDLKEGDKTQTSAAAVFTFGRRICLYFPRQGTFESPRYVGEVDDLKYLTLVVRHLHPGAGNVRWQPGGYLLFPNEKK